MRTKLFLAAMAAVAVVGCNKEMEGNGPVANTDETVSLINVSLKAAGTMTKAGESFEYGTEDENKIESATFYFFDADGKAYNVAEGTNAVELNAKNLTANAEETPGNIEAYTDVVLVLKSHKAAPPAQMVALINAGDYAGKSLAELEAAATEIQSETGCFVMSNSVYEGNQGVVTATQILPENIFVDPELEGTPGDIYEGAVEVEPVEIYVERVAAKVRVNAEAENGLIPVEGAEGTFAKILGWEVTNTTATSHLIKKYADTELFSPCNNAAFFRSYWAKTIKGAKAIHGLTFTDIDNALNSEAYYHENTLLETVAPEGWVNDVDKNGANDANETGIQAPQLIVAAQLVDAEGKAKEFAKWYGTDYENGDALKATMIANATKQIFVEGAEANTYVSIDIDDVTFYQIGDQTSYYEDGWNGDYRYEVRVKAKEGTKYFDAAGKAMDETAVNAILNKIEPAMIWAGGKTYYYTLIKHFGDAKGMVRNHLYDINITSIKGLGTPVYNEEFIITPEVPVEQDGYHLTATINVLSWNIISQDVVLGF